MQNRLLVPDLRDIELQGNQTSAALQTWGGFGMKLIEGHQYRLSPRLIDFNLAKILSTLLAMDLRLGDHDFISPNVPFWQLITNPRSLDFHDATSSTFAKEALKTENIIQSSFRQLHDLGPVPAGALILKSSQRRAARRILSQRLTIIWGPTGSNCHF